jgi:hypothetical protein
MAKNIKEVDLPKSFRIYHIDHSISSGYTHETPNALFDRLKNLEIPFLTDEDLDTYFSDSISKTNLISFRNWGLEMRKLNEIKHVV